MIEVSFTTFELAEDGHTWVELPVAEVVADGSDLAISGPHADWINPDITIVDPETRERVTRTDDVEHWARLLPFAYRDGDLAVQVAEVQHAGHAEPATAAFRYYAGA
jgi:hypothetical protein